MRNLPKKVKKYDILYVIWHDAYSPSQVWSEIDATCKGTAARCFSVGMYVGQNQHKDVMLAASWDTGNPPTINNVMGRPIAMIREIRLLQKAKKGIRKNETADS